MGQRGRKENFVLTFNSTFQLQGPSRSVLEGRIFYFLFLMSLGRHCFTRHQWFGWKSWQKLKGRAKNFEVEGRHHVGQHQGVQEGQAGRRWSKFKIKASRRLTGREWLPREVHGGVLQWNPLAPWVFKILEKEQMVWNYRSIGRVFLKNSKFPVNLGDYENSLYLPSAKAFLKLCQTPSYISFRNIKQWNVKNFYLERRNCYYETP